MPDKKPAPKAEPTPTPEPAQPEALTGKVVAVTRKVGGYTLSSSAATEKAANAQIDADIKLYGIKPD